VAKKPAKNRGRHKGKQGKGGKNRKSYSKGEMMRNDMAQRKEKSLRTNPTVRRNAGNHQERKVTENIKQWPGGIGGEKVTTTCTIVRKKSGTQEEK